MNDSILGRHSFSRFAVSVFQVIAPALVCVLSLRLVYFFTAEPPFERSYVALSVVTAALALTILQPPRYGSSTLIFDRSALVLGTLLRWACLVAVLLIIGYATKSSSDFSRQVVLTWIVVTPVVLIAVELGLHELARFLQLSSVEARRAVFAGCNEVSLALAERLKASPDTRIEVVGFFDDRSSDRLGVSPDVRLLGRLPDLAAFAKRNGIAVIFVALPMRHVQRVIDLLDDLRDTTASIYYVPDIFVYDLIQSRTGEILGMPVIAMCETPFYGYRGVVKRLTDVTISLVALLLLSPLLLVIALLVKLTSPGPVIFKQRRYGLDGEEITVYKFRSMKVTEDGERIEQARRGDPRLTPIGGFLRRTSLDELPQLINVLQGRMSLVGPRPHAVAHNEQYRRLIKGYMIRHKVRPGMTGLAQVNGCRGETAKLEEMQARVEYDIEYLRRWTPMLDLKILWRTFLLLFRRDEKAY